MTDNHADLIARLEKAIRSLQVIARGREGCGRPIAAEDAREIARRALTNAGLGWPKALRARSTHKGG